MREIRFCSIEKNLHNVYQATYKVMKSVGDFVIITFPQKKQRPKFSYITLRKKNFFNNSAIGTYYFGLKKVLRRENFDLIHVRTYYSLLTLVAIRYALKNKKPIIISEEQQIDPRKLIARIFFSLYFKFVKTVINKNKIPLIAVTKLSEKHLKKKGFSRVYYIPFAWKPTKKEKKNRFSAQLKILTVARFEWLKAHFVLIKAVHILINKYGLSKKDICVKLVGDGSLKKDAERMVKELALQDVIQFTGKVAHNKIGKYYRWGNLFILPSRLEMIGAVIPEAMEHSLPIICSDRVGSKDLVEKGKNGYIFKALDADDLAKKVLLLRDQKKREKFGEYSFRKLRDISPKIVGRELQQLFRMEIQRFNS